jgi:hypothetical protein
MVQERTKNRKGDKPFDLSPLRLCLRLAQAEDYSTIIILRVAVKSAAFKV